MSKVTKKTISWSCDKVLADRMDKLYGSLNRSDVINACVYAGICGDMTQLLERYRHDRAEWLADEDKRRRAEAREKAAKAAEKPTEDLKTQ